MLIVKENISRKLWNNFLILNNGSFLQSFEWGEFQKSFNKKVWRIAIFQSKKTSSSSEHSELGEMNTKCSLNSFPPSLTKPEGLSKDESNLSSPSLRESSVDDLMIASVQLIKDFFPLKGKSFFYIPFGPLFKKNIKLETEKESFSLILKKISQLALKENIIFLRIEPASILPILPKDFSSLLPPKRIQPQKVLLLDLRKEEEEIFQNFARKVRYNIKLAEKKGVKIEFKDKYIPEFYKLMKKTTKRDRFCSFEEEHYKKLFDFTSDDLKVKLCLAKYEEKVIAANILVFFGQKAIFVHSGSDWNYRSLKAPNLLRWEAMKMARNKGYEVCDFWGIDEKKWPGLTAFKKSFRGKELEYSQGVDVVFNKFWYWLYKIFRKMKKII